MTIEEQQHVDVQAEETCKAIFINIQHVRQNLTILHNHALINAWLWKRLLIMKVN